MIFVVENLGSVQTNLTVHGLNTRNKTQLDRPIANLSCFQKGVSYAAVKIFNSLPSSIYNLRNKKKKKTLQVCSAEISNDSLFLFH
jgi:hypothetical protein